ncbi:MAG: TRAP transporter small permease [Candidatus Ratteibacteria bacterium]
MIKGIESFVFQSSKALRLISGVALTFLMLLTIADVILRAFGKPIVGAYELVAFSGAIVIGFALPITSWHRGHIYVEFITDILPKKIRNAFHIITRLMGIIFFLLAGWNLFLVGMDLKRNQEVSLTLRLPFYPIAYGLAVSAFLLCLVLCVDIFKIVRGEYE